MLRAAYRERYGYLPTVYLNQEGGKSGNGDDHSNDDESDPPKEPAKSGGNAKTGDDDGKSDDESESYFATFKTKNEFDKRLNRAKRSALDEEAQKAGYKDHKEMVEAAQQLKQREQEEQTEIEREKKARETAEQQRDTAIAQAREDRLAARVERLCTTDDKEVREKFDKIVDPEAALDMMNREQIAFNDDGSIDGVEDALAELLQRKPYLRVSADKPERPVRGTPKAAEDESSPSFISGYLNRRYAKRSS